MMFDAKRKNRGETNQWEAFSASVFTLVNNLLCHGTNATTTMLKSD